MLMSQSLTGVSWLVDYQPNYPADLVDSCEFLSVYWEVC